ncbi:synaptobrevin-1-like [Pectinophora gossypiella]|uniref:V-SNARE coiled-coil homology domain-containing protein n=1 Tax=Pectinophora gossypiella TaxID=13191 RepID=A0A1E1WLB6_PECGO|nr:synaptobrevin-1-like [Pectinophora gossypiella]
MEEQGGSSAPRVSDKRLAQTQAKVDEVVGIMRVNVEKVLERDSKLSELDNRADALQHGAAQFEQQAGKLKRKYWWQNLKMMLIIGGIGAVLLIIIIVWATSGNNNTSTAAPVNPPPAPDSGR